MEKYLTTSDQPQSLGELDRQIYSSEHTHTHNKTRCQLLNPVKPNNQLLYTRLIFLDSRKRKSKLSQKTPIQKT